MEFERDANKVTKWKMIWNIIPPRKRAHDNIFFASYPLLEIEIAIS